MKIISKFHDYYDSGMAFGQDDEVTWIRTSTETTADHLSLGIESRDWFRDYELFTKSWKLKAHNEFVAFCGELHQLYIGVVEQRFYPYRDPETLFASSSDELRQKFFSFAKEKEVEYGQNKYYSRPWYQKIEDKHRKQRRDAIAKYLQSDCSDLHRRYDCPVLRFTKNDEYKQPTVKVELCPKLGVLGFQRVKDAFTAYQDIAMYISGVMGQKQNPMVPIEDKSMVLKKGFDPVYGFRTRPTK